MVNLFMAVLWLILAGAAFVWQYLHPGDRAFTLFGSGNSFGWLGIVLALYNLARWWSSRASARSRKAMDDTWERRQRTRERDSSQPAQARDPSFDFRDEKPPGG